MKHVGITRRRHHGWGIARVFLLSRVFRHARRSGSKRGPGTWSGHHKKNYRSRQGGRLSAKLEGFFSAIRAHHRLAALQNVPPGLWEGYSKSRS
ncbi:MAG: hypothetical protein CM15mP125_0340 [Gammaproteobacteria bacterium]|nr:MAG: hypothetical protein CM15mP125_0340 [Gammaproteobacteria bacterium]